ncbi:hypothetical protein [Symbioplanes lichenis]|uniref:hypothetical protein n=1 Tax=Symbioplanes lichenis TaxID=1629072 RepID=UPI002738BB4F|nr:hypothetical protein [Actinoplanes lichenis]
MDQQPPLDPGPLPAIADYWPDAPHRMSPPADYYDGDPTPAPPGPVITLRTRDEPTPPRRRRYGLVVTLALLLIVAGAGVVLWRHDPLDIRTPAALPAAPGLAPASPSPADTGPPGLGEDPWFDSAGPPAAYVTAPAGGRTTGTFELVSDAAFAGLLVGDTGADLYRITARQGSSITPRVVEADGKLRLFLDPAGRPGDEEVEVTLSGAVRWQITVSGGLSRGLFGLDEAKLSGLTLAGDAADLELHLPRPSGTLPVRVSGGIDQFSIKAGRGVPVRVRTRRGAGEVTFDGRKDEGVARNATFQNAAFRTGRNRIDVDATAGVGTLKLARS